MWPWDPSPQQLITRQWQKRDKVGPLVLKKGQSQWALGLIKEGLPSLLENKSERQQSSLKYRIWALIICTASGQRHKGSNNHIHTVFFRSSCSLFRLKRHDTKGLGLPLHSGQGQLAPVLCPAYLSTVTSARSPCSLWLPSPQSHSLKRSQMSHARRSLGERRRCSVTNVSAKHHLRKACG